MNRPYYILLADNHRGFCREMRKILEEIPGIKVTGEAGNRRELFELLRHTPPQLVILDISLSREMISGHSKLRYVDAAREGACYRLP